VHEGRPRQPKDEKFLKECVRFPKWSQYEEDDDYSGYCATHDPLQLCDSGDTWRWGHTAIDLFLSAEAYDIPLLRQDAIDRLVQCFHYIHTEDEDSETWAFNYEVVDRVFDQTDEKPNSPLRKIMIDGYCLGSELPEAWPTTSCNNMSDTHKGFLAGVAKAYSRLLRKREAEYGEGVDRKRKLASCDYHEHGTEEHRKRCTGNQSHIDDAERHFKGHIRMLG
jgi:hypothetical protein